MFCSRKQGTVPLVYFDCNATTPTLPRAAEAAWRAMRETYGNPSSVHTSGLQAKQILLDAHDVAARILAVRSEEIVFTSGATEGIQMAVVSALSAACERRRRGEPLPRLLLYGATEHKAVPQALHHWNRLFGLDFEIRSIPVGADGTLDLNFLQCHASDAWFIATMAVNNETGVFQDLRALRSAIRGASPEVLWMVDCVQALGKMALDFSSLDVDYAVFSGHKLYAPKGIGFFYFRKGAPLVPLIVGGGQERGLRSGTENIPGLAAFVEVLRLLENDGEEVFRDHETLLAYRERIATALRESFPEVLFNAPFERAVPTCLNFSVPGFASREILDAFDAAGVRVSAGSACSATRAAQSFVLDAMGFPQWRSAGAVRLSFGPATTPDEIERGVERIGTAARWLSGCGLQGVKAASAPEAGSRDLDGVVQFRDGYANAWAILDSSSRKMLLIDPRREILPAMKRAARRNGMEVSGILFTHIHGREGESCDAWVHELWPEAARHVVRAPLQDAGWSSRVIEGLGDCRTLAFGCGLLAAIPAPGHTSDSLCFLWFPSVMPDALRPSQAAFAFVGDTVLTNGIGRSDRDGGSADALFHSLRTLATVLGDKTILCPAHDYTDTLATSWEAERRWNPLLKAALALPEEDFIVQKRLADARISDDSECAHWASSTNTRPTTWMVSDEEMNVTEVFLEKVSADAELVAIDVRESYEHAFLDTSSGVSFEKPLRNVPLSRFANFMAECLQKSGANTSFVFVCRSGGRALQAARSFRLLGYEHSWSLAGGVACGCAAETK